MKYLGYVLIALVIGVVFITVKATSDYNRLRDALESKQQELVMWKDKDSLNNAKIAVIEATRKELMTVIAKQDKALQEALKDRKTQTFTRINTVTKLDTFFKVDVDTVSCNFNAKMDNGWVSQRISLKNDTLKIDSLTVINKFELTEKKVKGGSELIIKNLNPYTTTTDLQVYKVTQPKKRVGFWIVVGFGLGVLLNVL